MHKDTESHQCVAGSEPTTSELLRRRSRELREESINLERLADNLEHFSGEAGRPLAALVGKALYPRGLYSSW